MKLIVAILVVLALVSDASAQLMRVYTPPSAAPCKTTVVTPNNSAVDWTVNTAAFVVMTADATRCGAIILNTSAVSAKCVASAQTNASATRGFLIPAGTGLVLGLEGQQAWNCSPVTTAPTISVIESRP